MGLFVKAGDAIRQKDTVRVLRIARALAFLRRISSTAESAVLEHIAGIARTGAHAGLLQQCLSRLDTFRVSRQVDAIETILTRLRGGSAAGPYADVVEATR